MNSSTRRSHKFFYLGNCRFSFAPPSSSCRPSNSDMLIVSYPLSSSSKINLILRLVLKFKASWIKVRRHTRHKQSPKKCRWVIVSTINQFWNAKHLSPRTSIFTTKFSSIVLTKIYLSIAIHMLKYLYVRDGEKRKTREIFKYRQSILYT